MNYDKYFANINSNFTIIKHVRATSWWEIALGIRSNLFMHKVQLTSFYYEPSQWTAIRFRKDVRKSEVAKWHTFKVMQPEKNNYFINRKLNNMPTINMLKDSVLSRMSSYSFKMYFGGELLHCFSIIMLTTLFRVSP